MTATLEQPPVNQSINQTEMNSEDGVKTSQIVSFRLASEEYGLDIMGVQEIILPSQITGIPESPEYIRGLINLRGKVIPIIDLRRRFHLAVSDHTEHTRIVVVNAGTTTFGIVVDAVDEVLRIETKQIEPPPKGAGGMDQAYIRGLVKMENKIMILLNMEAVLSNEDQDLLTQSSKGGKKQ